MYIKKKDLVKSGGLCLKEKREKEKRCPSDFRSGSALTV